MCARNCTPSELKKSNRRNETESGVERREKTQLKFGREPSSLNVLNDTHWAVVKSARFEIGQNSIQLHSIYFSFLFDNVCHNILIWDWKPANHLGTLLFFVISRYWEWATFDSIELILCNLRPCHSTQRGHRNVKIPANSVLEQCHYQISMVELPSNAACFARSDSNANRDIYFADTEGNACHKSITHD